MKRNEKLVIQGNEFYVIDLDCLEKQKRENNSEKTDKKKINPIKRNIQK